MLVASSAKGEVGNPFGTVGITTAVLHGGTNTIPCLADQRIGSFDTARLDSLIVDAATGLAGFGRNSQRECHHTLGSSASGHLCCAPRFVPRVSGTILDDGDSRLAIYLEDGGLHLLTIPGVPSERQGSRIDGHSHLQGGYRHPRLEKSGTGQSKLS